MTAAATDEKATKTPVLQLAGVSHSYASGGRKRIILKNVSHSFQSGRMYAVVGPSGSGKTTLLALASGLDTPVSGKVRFRGDDVAELGLGRYRNRHVATVFQNLNLLNYMTAVQNVVSAMEITGARGGRKKQRAEQILTRLGVEPVDQHRRTLQLSGGQQQRVAIARALACEVDVLFADEPTGSLDQDTATEIVTVFRALAHEEGKCVIVVTHSREVAAAADEVLRLRAGALVKG
ncbi:ABC transporter ATP-binding protein [Catenulispora pinisilvae]|uniref:ABC transporter ATP-binding protein n=1 Tax=Catenulispora pinisilvae TaxID=2705253 RepID=UPI00189113DB|nr:ABC transporter ATP-binding protein [Catenulispora pinisilvae]